MWLAHVRGAAVREHVGAPCDEQFSDLLRSAGPRTEARPTRRTGGEMLPAGNLLRCVDFLRCVGSDEPAAPNFLGCVGSDEPAAPTSWAASAQTRACGAIFLGCVGSDEPAAQTSWAASARRACGANFLGCVGSDPSLRRRLPEAAASSLNEPLDVGKCPPSISLMAVARHVTIGPFTKPHLHVIRATGDFAAPRVGGGTFIFVRVQV